MCLVKPQKILILFSYLLLKAKMEESERRQLEYEIGSSFSVAMLTVLSIFIQCSVSVSFKCLCNNSKYEPMMCNSGRDFKFSFFHILLSE